MAVARCTYHALCFLFSKRGIPDHELASFREPYARNFGAAALEALGVDLVVDDSFGVLRTRDANRAQPSVILPNHTSALDILISYALFGGVMLSRGDIASWPVAGSLARLGGTIFVDRESRTSGASAIRAVRRALQSGTTVTLFPEGTTHAGDTVAEFHAGAFAAAAGLEVDVIPVGIAYDPPYAYTDVTIAEHVAAVASARRIRAAVTVGQPIRVARARGAAESAEVARVTVQGLVHQSRAMIA